MMMNFRKIVMPVLFVFLSGFSFLSVSCGGPDRFDSTSDDGITDENPSENPDEGEGDEGDEGDGDSGDTGDTDDTDGEDDDGDTDDGDEGDDDGDTDDDGVLDAEDAFPTDAAESVDTDGDGVGDNSDNCPADSNAGQADADADGEGDVCDDDVDGDGIANEGDNCPDDSNSDQTDLDEDGTGDACDDDVDGDGVPDEEDAFPTDATESADTDGDGVGDNSDVCPDVSDDQSDGDEDGAGDVCDNCVTTANSDQEDMDGDGEGNACDEDIDGDGDLAEEFGGADCDDEDDHRNGIRAEVFDLRENNCDDADGYDLGIDLADSTATVEGDSAGDELGYAVSIPGDVNGDGFADVMIGAPKNDAGASGAGKAYLFFGSAGGLSGALDPDSADVIMEGEGSNNYFGWSISGPGDVNGDGFDDILIGAKWNHDGGYRAGKVYLIYGRDFADQEFDLADADAAFTGGATGDYLGSSVAGAGDVDGDGLADIIMSATGYDGTYSSAGRVYLFLGGDLAGDVSLTDAYATFEGEAAYDAAGTSLAPAGDMDGDGLADFIVGAPSADPSGKTSAGKIYVIFGDNIDTGENALADADLKYTGENANNNAGNMISGGVDVDADGLSDIVIGAYGYDVGASTNEGRAYLIFGSDSYTAGTYSLNGADMVFDGEASGDYAGSAVSLIDDMDGDGFGEIMIGAYYNDEAANNAGKIYFIKGMSQDDFDDLGGEITLGDASVDATILGETSGSYAGYSLSTGGDPNGDGIMDTVIGAYGFDGADGSDTGKAYLLLGE
ncbi:MAG: FG-GAP repeat protein [Deltaproteobacteria bacterium]|nr:FG-GAP repeat protein [Deltaproteobacteria bacterium]